MEEYLLVLIIGVALSAYSFFSSKRGSDSKVLYWAYLTLLALMTGFRDMIGGYDVYNYIYFFEQLPPSMEVAIKEWGDYNIWGYEPLYYLYNVLLRSVGANAQLFLFVSAVIPYAIIGKAYSGERFSLFILFILSAKFFIPGFIYIRQFIALGVLWSAMPLLRRDRLRHFCLLVLVASLFHYSSLIALLVLPFRKRQISRKAVTLALFSCLFLGLVSAPKLIVVLLAGAMDISKLLSYGTAQEAEVHWAYLFECLFLGIGLLLLYDRLSKKIPTLYLNTFVLYLCLTLLTLRDPGLLRLQWFFFVGYAVTIPHLLLSIKAQAARHLSFVLLISLLSVLFVRNVMVRDEGNFIPYKAFFQDKRRVDKFQNDY